MFHRRSNLFKTMMYVNSQVLFTIFSLCIHVILLLHLTVLNLLHSYYRSCSIAAVVLLAQSSDVPYKTITSTLATNCSPIYFNSTRAAAGDNDIFHCLISHH